MGRVSDWHKAASTIGTATSRSIPSPPSCASEDPGVRLTAGLKEYFVTHGFSTEVMAASFRNAGQVAALAGCDHLTIGERGREKKGMKEDVAAAIRTRSSYSSQFQHSLEFRRKHNIIP